VSAQYEVLALRYGEYATTRSEEFYRYEAYDEPDGDLMRDYFLWVVRNDEHTILVDTGYHPSAIVDRPGRVCLVSPMEALEKVGVEPESVTQVVVTHFHFDHIGNVSSFPQAEVVLQRRELDFWLGPYGRHAAAASSVERRETEYLRDLAVSGRATVLDGDATVAPGIALRLVGGHCPGQQIVLVHDTEPVVLASDSLHFYEEMDRDMPFEVFFDLEGMYRTYELLRGLQSDSGATIVAGHDPEVMRRFAPIDTAAPDLGVVLTCPGIRLR